VLQLLKMTDKWTEHLDSDGQIDTIYGDFENASDEVPHRRLMQLAVVHVAIITETVLMLVCCRCVW